jgi:ATP-dependent DNA ligase
MSSWRRTGRTCAEERRKRLAKLLSRSNKALRDGIQVTEAITGDGAAIFHGIVSKRIGSRYLSGRTRAWLKSKNRISAALAASFDHLVGADDKRRRKREAERLCSLEIKNQL